MILGGNVEKNAHLPPPPPKNPDRVDAYGEVFTPPSLIQEVLDHLPKSVWKSPEKRWLDPCAGTANFLDHLLPRLMESLAVAIPSAARRRRHILETMVVLVEKNPANVREIRRKYPRTPVISRDFLELDQAAVGGPVDVVLANPPYQSPKEETYSGSSGNRTLWDAFLEHAMSVASPQACLGFITPANWRRPEHPLWAVVGPRLHYLHIYGKQAGMELFRVQTRFDVYVFTAKPRANGAPIPLLIDEYGAPHRKEIDTAAWPFLPNGEYKTIQHILVQDPAQGIPVIFDSSLYDARKLTKHKTALHKYPVIHTLTMDGIGLRYATKRSPTQYGRPKIILNMNEKQYPINDFQGKYGMSQLSFGLPIRSEAEGDRIIRYINSEPFQRILEATKWGSFQTDYRMFKYFRPDFWKIK